MQRKLPDAVFNDMAALDAPGLMSPTTVPSSRTMWCNTAVLFVQTIWSPTFAETTSGENAVLPLLPTIEIVVAFAVGVVGVLGAALPPPPLHADIAVTHTALAIVRTHLTYMYSCLLLL